ncbi:MAG: hypothetical protein JW755_08405 [Candidatus Aminicenantes bacterium]|nr:hypothetical protein [Candidatus Aminicenantes bacterium]
MRNRYEVMIVKAGPKDIPDDIFMVFPSKIMVNLRESKEKINYLISGIDSSRNKRSDQILL